jgi:hypothetical protein
MTTMKTTSHMPMPTYTVTDGSTIDSLLNRQWIRSLVGYYTEKCGF